MAQKKERITVLLDELSDSVCFINLDYMCSILCVCGVCGVCVCVCCVFARSTSCSVWAPEGEVLNLLHNAAHKGDQPALSAQKSRRVVTFSATIC